MADIKISALPPTLAFKLTDLLAKVDSVGPTTQRGAVQQLFDLLAAQNPFIFSHQLSVATTIVLNSDGSAVFSNGRFNLSFTGGISQGAAQSFLDGGAIILGDGASGGTASFANSDIVFNADGSAFFAVGKINFNADGSASFDNNSIVFGDGAGGGSAAFANNALIIDSSGVLISQEIRSTTLAWGSLLVSSLLADGSLIINGGTPVLKIISATASLDFPNTLAQTSSDLTITLTGAALGDCVQLGVPNGSVLPNSSYSAFVSAANTVTVRFTNAGVLSRDPASGTFRVAIMQF